jgi:hypothetical protein
MTKDKAKKESNKTDDNILLHWLFPVITFLLGIYASGYFHDVARDKKSNVMSTSRLAK